MGQNNNRLLYLTEREGRTGEYWPEVVVVRSEGCYLRWPTTVTSKRNAQQIQIAHSKFKIAHSKLQIAHSKLQIAHSKFKSLTANSNRPQQIQIAHSKLQIFHSKFKSLTANSNCSQQIKVAYSKLKSLTANSIAHSKLKSPTTNYKLLTPQGVFGYLQPAVQLV